MALLLTPAPPPPPPLGMVHTRYHFKVHSSALQGALARLGAALSSPLLTAECAAREVENVHAEYRSGGGAGVGSRGGGIRQ